MNYDDEVLLTNPTAYVSLLMLLQGLTRAEAKAELNKRLKEQADDYENRRGEATEEAGTEA